MLNLSTQTLDRVRRAYQAAAGALIDQATAHGPWVGELSSSALSTATAIAALELVRRDRQKAAVPSTPLSERATRPELVQRDHPEAVDEFDGLIQGGLEWLTKHQNTDGGWGDTVISFSNISTTTLVYASFLLADSCEVRVDAGDSSHATRDISTDRANAIARAKSYIDANGGFAAIRQRYGKDHTFSVPILTQCALAGLVPWNELPQLPFELGWLPHWFYRWIRLPVVSYALPALIAIGQVRHYHAPSWNPFMRWIRQMAVGTTLRRLIGLQPESGGFLEATPLTSFVTMSLAKMGLADHPVARRGVDFITASVRPDGSWPIDTNLATWVTTLSVNALARESLSENRLESISNWLLGQQHRTVHRYTNAEPGGWAWTDLTGGVPDADDTPGAILALLKLSPKNRDLKPAVTAAIEWLLNLQNRDGGWPTFCRGWGALPFDRSAPDLTAHALRAIRAWLRRFGPNATSSGEGEPFGGSNEQHTRFLSRIDQAVTNGFAFLQQNQRRDGTWVPLWFGNQFTTDEENPVYGVSRVLAAYRDWGRLSEPVAQSAISWLNSVQNADGGWGGAANTPSSVEETALALEILFSVDPSGPDCSRGLDWLLVRIETEQYREAVPIGLYFAKLWYFERLYPIIFTVSAVARVIEEAERCANVGPESQDTLAVHR